MVSQNRPVEPHLSPEAKTLRRELSEQFDRAAHTPEESLRHARELRDELKRQGRWLPTGVR